MIIQQIFISSIIHEGHGKEYLIEVCQCVYEYVCVHMHVCLLKLLCEYVFKMYWDISLGVIFQGEQRGL